MFNDYARRNGFLKEKDSNLTGEDFREGLSCVLTTMVKNPQFEGQTKGRLGNSEVRPAVEGIITQQLTDWLENLKNQEIAQQIVQKAIRAAQVREAARKTRDNARKANQLDAAPLVGKLSACRGKRRRTMSCSSSRAIPQAAAPSRGATAAIRRFSPCAASPSMPKRSGWIRC